MVLKAYPLPLPDGGDAEFLALVRSISDHASSCDSATPALCVWLARLGPSSLPSSPHTSVLGQACSGSRLYPVQNIFAQPRRTQVAADAASAAGIVERQRLPLRRRCRYRCRTSNLIPQHMRATIAVFGDVKKKNRTDESPSRNAIAGPRGKWLARFGFCCYRRHWRALAAAAAAAACCHSCCCGGIAISGAVGL